MPSPIDDLKVTQVGFVCRDIETSKQEFARFLGQPVPQTVHSGEFAATRTQYLGQDAPLAACLMAFFNLPNTQFELIQPNEAHSVWRDDLDSKGEGFHHVAYVVKGMAEHTRRMQEAGFELVQKGEYGSGGGRYAYFKGGLLGMTVELLEND
ncbi:MAG: VOC family protein [Clostridia bacterium]|nr:VOC family protein [Clostridia bacterium]